MNATSRPLRALGVTLGGWTVMRVVMLWPTGSAAEIPNADAARAAPIISEILTPFETKAPLFATRSALQPKAMTPVELRASTAQDLRLPYSSESRGFTSSRALSTAGLQPAQENSASAKAVLAATPLVPGLPTPTAHNRFSGSAWALMRGNGAPSLASGGQLGGSQIGVRLFYTPGPEAVALTVRISAPLSQRAGREAAVGVALRGRNVGLIAEQRIALDRGGRDAPALFAYGGVYDVKLPGRLKLDGYAQAGVVGVKNPAAFVDGAIRVERAVLKAKKASLSVGAGLWGGAQPGVSRIDIGPQIVARIAVAETSLRVSAEWRQRVAGDAAPASGPSVTVGFDF